ncbi:hypothetical protein BZA05DRAFT_131633 [Tricharina praecox]|uniref:uncharacterized protein n=1 Tax=Tricharina praecox TaxID=43433 RepID=UPI00221EF9C2|nr:uncharacterized protein BZA05DRAFT_131633 [Tricharina praecox]KAI5846975.1 hypothetical protein BZA05DRAFT_131633 [Tricharina praecox]
MSTYTPSSASSSLGSRNPFLTAPENTPSRSRSQRVPRSSRPSSTPRRHSSPHRHRRKISQIPGPDPIDRLGAIGGAYHHDGPFEATLFARQQVKHAPIEAVKYTNAAALAATPKASIQDSLEGHYPLQGTAMYRPGEGGLGDYEEYDVNVRDGKWGRWDHMYYRDEDRRAKGEPGYTVGEFEKQQKAARRARSASSGGRPNEFEMRRSAGNTHAAKDRSSERVRDVGYGDYYSSGSTSKMDGLKKRVKAALSTRT